MQTHFTPEQLQNPDTARANDILRACVHCGFCTATCPTYQMLGDELDSPRGRIYLIKEMLESGRPADARTVRHVDRCLSCLSCMTTCPSGVHYAHLVDHARAYIEETYRRPLPEHALRAMLAQILPYPMRFRLALGLAKLARPFQRAIPGKRLRAMIALAPKDLPSLSRDDDPQTHAAQGPRKLRVAMLTGCAQKALNSDINAATRRLLTRLGCEVVIPEGLGCCGALPQHMGRKAQAEALSAQAIRALIAEDARAPLDAVVINTSGCGTVMKDFGHHFRNDPALAEAAAKIAALSQDVTEVIARLDLPAPVALPKLRVAYHSACSLQHGQQIKSLPRALLSAAGFEVVEPREAHLCCGSAGTYNILQPEISDQLRARKVASLEAKAPDVITGGNIGCLMQIGAGTSHPVVHTVELLDWAYGGLRPGALETA